MRIGTTLDTKCQYDLQQLTDKNSIPRQVNKFYELYLVDYNGDWIDIPVKIKNVRRKFYKI